MKTAGQVKTREYKQAYQQIRKIQAQLNCPALLSPKKEQKLRERFDRAVTTLILARAK